VTLERPLESKGTLPQDIDKRLRDIRLAETFEKNYFDLTKEKKIRDHLARLKKTQVIVAGCETDVCVLQSCLGLIGLGPLLQALALLLQPLPLLLERFAQLLPQRQPQLSRPPTEVAGHPRLLGQGLLLVVQGLLLLRGQIAWATENVSLGMWRNYFAAHIDDIFLGDDRWDTVNKTTHEDDGATLPMNRMAPADVTRAVNWERANGIKLDFVFNGQGMDDAIATNGSDPLSTALLQNKSAFRWINHTYDHRSFTGLSTHLAPLTISERTWEITRTERVLQSIGGATVRPYFRPPFGDYDAATTALLARLGYRYMIMWTVDSLGWDHLPAPAIFQRCLAALSPGAIVLMHVGIQSQDALALQPLILAVKRRGYAFVTVAALLSKP